MHSLMHNCTQLTATTAGQEEREEEQTGSQAARQIEIVLMAMLENYQSLGEGYNNLAKMKTKEKPQTTSIQIQIQCLAL